MALYTVLQTVAINNRNVVLYLVEGEEIELPEEEAAHIIPLGYIEEPAPPPGVEAHHRTQRDCE